MLGVPYLLWVLNITSILTALALTFSLGMLSSLYYRYFNVWPMDYHLGLAVMALCALLIDYVPFMDDEFNLWASGPIRMTIENTLLPTARSQWDTYTPFANIWGLYFQQLIQFQTFAGDTGIYLSRATLWFTLIYGMKESVGKRLDGRILMVLIAFGMTSLYRAKAFHSLVIEGALFPIIIYNLMCAKNFLNSQDAQKKFPIPLGLGLISSYMFKKTLIPLLFSFFYWAYKRVKIPALIGFVILFCLVALSWHHACSKLPELWRYGFSEGWWYDARAMTVYKALYIHLVKYWNHWLLLALGFWMMSKNPKLASGWSIFVVIYAIGLIVTYLQSFTDLEASKLASFRRYLSLCIVPTVIMGAYCWLSTWKSKPSTKDFVTTPLLLITLLGPLFYYSHDHGTVAQEARDRLFNSNDLQLIVKVSSDPEKDHALKQQYGYYGRIFSYWNKELKVEAKP